MSTTRRVGDPLPEHAPATRITEMSLRVLPIDMIVQWHRCSMMADFLANYLAYHFENRPSAIHVLSSGLNELIENLTKFSADKRAPVDLVITHYGDHLQVTTQNQAWRAQTEALASRLDRMATTDPEELFLEQLEHTASADRAASGLGLITVKKDYGALIGAEISPVEGTPDLFTVRVILELDVNAVEQA